MDKYLISDTLINQLEKQSSFDMLEITVLKNGSCVSLFFIDENGEKVKNGGKKK